jgi:hypothetical protein
MQISAAGNNLPLITEDELDEVYEHYTRVKASIEWHDMKGHYRERMVLEEYLDEMPILRRIDQILESSYAL